MRSTLGVLGCWLAGCGGGGSGTLADAAPDTPAPPPWWQPQDVDAKDWDIQLSGNPSLVVDPSKIDVSAPRVMYDLDLWALVPSPTTLDYGDGDPVMVPAGVLAGTIAQLHARTPSTIVICHVETGALELNRPDARKFPGYLADTTKIPDNPDAIPTPPVTGNPAANSVIGWSITTPIERRLDIREASRARWIAIMFKRFDLAKQIGCDGVEPERNQVPDSGTGFPSITAPESYSWYAELANQGHMRMLSTGMKNGILLGGQPDEEAPMFDWLMVERCGEGGDCGLARPFVNLHKPVFAIEYPTDSEGMPQTMAVVCGTQQTAQIVDGLIKDLALTKSVRMPCSP